MGDGELLRRCQVGWLIRGRVRPGVHWVELRLVGQVGFPEWTADGQHRQPRFQGLRDDNDPPTWSVRCRPSRRGRPEILAAVAAV